MRVNMKKTSKDKEHYLLKIFSFQKLSVDMTDHSLVTLHSSPVNCQKNPRSHELFTSHFKTF